ncbi:MAG: hypothetical protein M1825_006482 [Sarcosagium campestre]|nr:MAG: hypothetical protein M1825_006482 [Sarcosagium campestre]
MPAPLSPADYPLTFPTLISSLSRVLGPSSGLTSSDVDLAELTALMQSYDSNPVDWASYSISDPSRGYTRNMVDRGNGKSNVLVVVWSPGKGRGSPIHDHAGAHCLMKVLKGRLTETRYAWPAQDHHDSLKEDDLDHSQRQACCGTRRKGMKCIGEKSYGENEVTYMSDELGLHRIWNPDQHNVAVSLHLYTPPHVATTGCAVFNETTGKASHVPEYNVYSEAGIVLSPVKA